MIAVPESVLAYFEQSSLRTAVDLLLSGKEPKVPMDLQWNEVPAFYRACLAARQVPADFAIFTEGLWREVWGDVPEGWKPRAPSDPDRPDLAISIATIWSEGCFSRRFEQRGFAIELSVGLWTDTGLQLGVLLYDKNEKVLFREDSLDGWSSEGYDTFWSQDHIASLAPTISAEPFRRWTDHAWTAISSSMNDQ